MEARGSWSYPFVGLDSTHKRILSLGSPERRKPLPLTSYLLLHQVLYAYILEQERVFLGPRDLRDSLDCQLFLVDAVTSTQVGSPAKKRGYPLRVSAQTACIPCIYSQTLSKDERRRIKTK